MYPFAMVKSSEGRIPACQQLMYENAKSLSWVDGLNRSASGSGRPSLRLSVH
jgi:hypothetical protein